jgi:hypothetical protein
MREGDEISAELDVVCQQLDHWHYGELSAQDRAELEAAKAELVQEANARIDWLWDNLPEGDEARNYDRAAELAELTEYLRSIGE